MEFGELKGFLPGLVARLEKTLPYAAAFASRKRGLKVVCSSTQVQLLDENPHAGVCVSLWNGSQFYEYASNRLDAAAIEKECGDLARRAAASRPAKPLDLDPGEALHKDFAAPCALPGHKVALKDKLAYARALQAETAGQSPRVQNAVAACGDLECEEIFVNRSRRLSQVLHRYDESAQVYVSDGTRTQHLWEGESLAGGWELQGVVRKALKPMVADAERLLKSPRLEPGTYEVVCDPHWSGILAHEAFGHGMETDMFPKDRARGRDYIGKPVASEITTLYDDPSKAGEAGSFFFDHEGASARPNRIIDSGKLVAGMTDLYSAGLLKLPRSANGRRESWERKAYARMTNTFFAPGKSKPADLFAQVRDGWYLRYPSNGMEDPQGWGIQCEGLWAQRILDGKLTEEVRSPVIMTGYVPELLQSIRMVADDLRISGSGYCGKGHKEYLKNTTGGPHLLLKARLA